MRLNHAAQVRRAQLSYDSQCEPESEISDEAFQDACGDIALEYRDHTDDLGELINIIADSAFGLSYIASEIGFPPNHEFQLRELLEKAEAIRERVNEQARIMS